MFDSAVVNLTLVDLPGLTKVAVGKYHGSYFCTCISLSLYLPVEKCPRAMDGKKNSRS